jgi:hypothetical protein
MPSRADVTVQSVSSKLRQALGGNKGWPGVLGNAAGTVDVQNHPGYVYLRDANGQGAGIALNNAVPKVAGLNVWVGNSPAQPGMWQILGVRELGAAGSGVAGWAENVAPHNIASAPHDDVDRTVAPINGDVLQYVVTGGVGLWTPRPAGAALDDLWIPHVIDSGTFTPVINGEVFISVDTDYALICTGLIIEVPTASDPMSGELMVGLGTTATPGDTIFSVPASMINAIGVGVGKYILRFPNDSVINSALTYTGVAPVPNWGHDSDVWVFSTADETIQLRLTLLGIYRPVA